MKRKPTRILRQSVKKYKANAVKQNTRVINNLVHNPQPKIIDNIPQLNTNISKEYVENLFTKYASYDAPCIAITHLYFTDLVDETISYLKKIPYKCKFIFTLTKGTSDNRVIHNKLNKEFPDCIILPMKNAGKDICPKLKAVKWLRENKPGLKYKYLLFLHDKKHGNTNLGFKWRTALYKALTSDKMFTSGFEIMERDRRVKMVSAWRWVIYSKTCGVMFGGKGTPKDEANLKRACQILNLNVPNYFGFVGGTMFWCDFEHFNVFWDNDRLNAAINEMDKELGNVQEPSFTHAVERVFGMMVTSFIKGNIMKI